MDKETGYDEAVYEQFFALVGAPEEGKKYTQARAAKELGYSSGAISAYKNRTYGAGVTGLQDKIAAWVKRVTRRSEALVVPIIDTSTMQQIRRAVTLAQDHKDIALIIGDSSVGKTEALKQYVRESRSAYLVEVDDSFTKHVLVQEIAKTIGVDHRGTLATVVRRIIDDLRGRDAVLIIDEADYVSDRALELLRRTIHDKACVGVVLAGLPQLEYRIRNLRNNHEQLANRVGVLLKVRRLQKPDALKILTAVWPSLDGDTIKAFVDGAAGSVRTLTKLMARAAEILHLNTLAVPDVDVVDAAGELLMKN